MLWAGKGRWKVWGQKGQEARKELWVNEGLGGEENLDW